MTNKENIFLIICYTTQKPFNQVKITVKSWESIQELRSANCHIYGITQVNASRLNHSIADWHSIYLSWRNRKLS